MLNFQDCQNIVNHKINELKLPDFPSNLYDPVRYMLNLEAKRVRPCIVLMACNVFSDAIDNAIYPALAIEVFHNFTLIHDDLMDKSDLRRNHATVHKKWNPDIAVLSGDAMLIKAYELLSDAPHSVLPGILPVFNRTALEVCEGQQYDMDFEKSLDVSIDDYLTMIEFKTAVLLAASLKIGAIAGGAGDEQSETLYRFGRDLGIAFQLQDDWLDVFSDARVFGKVTGNDIVTNKKTILLIEALNNATGKIRTELLHWLNLDNFDREEKITVIRSIYQQLGIDMRVKERVRTYHQKAIQHLDNLEVPEQRKAILRDFSAYLMHRQK